MILFLDFDGVLHPEGEDHTLNGGTDFCFSPRLEALLREFLHVRTVISSSWHEQLRYETLLKPFSSDIRARILGATPHSGFGPPPPYRQREGEILAWRQILDAVDEPGSRSTTRTGSSTAARTTWWCAIRSRAPMKRQVLLFARALKERPHESADSFRSTRRRRSRDNAACCAFNVDNGAYLAERFDEWRPQ